MTSNEQMRPVARAKKTAEVFRERCLFLIIMGYQTIDVASMRSKEELAVTGHLATAIRKWFDSLDCPSWTNFYSLHEDEPCSTPEREGKNRFKPDLRFELTVKRPRTWFSLEAKWVGKEKESLGSKKGYLGQEGIGCFLSGKYPVENRQAGMLAYVYSDGTSHWEQKIAEKLIEKQKDLYLERDREQPWNRSTSLDLPAFRTLHKTTIKRVGTIEVFHLLLDFSPPDSSS